jgi:LysM repeat protein
VTWKKLAKLNGLAPPYTLLTGQTIKLPATTKKSAKKSRREA